LYGLEWEFIVWKWKKRIISEAMSSLPAPELRQKCQAMETCPMLVPMLYSATRTALSHFVAAVSGKPIKKNCCKAPIPLLLASLGL